jgi:hypothetical protein
MRRREFIAGFGGAVAWPLASLAQQGERVRRIGVLAFEGVPTAKLLRDELPFWNDRQFPEHRNPGVVILPGANGDQTDMINGLTWMTLLMRRNPEHWIKRKVRISRDGDVYIKSRLRRTGAMHTDHFRFTNGVHAVVAV